MKEDIRYRLLAVGQTVEDGDEEYSANELMDEAEAWRPVAAEFIGEAVQENDPPVRRVLVRRLRRAGEQVMDLGKALEIVWEMAKSLYNSHGEFCKPANCPADATTAMTTVEDFIVNDFEDEGNPGIQERGRMNRKILWLVPKGQRTAHAYRKSIQGGNDEFWCGIVRNQYEVRYPRNDDASCKRCIAYIRHARKARGKEERHA
jgi:hypothetical protein